MFIALLGILSSFLKCRTKVLDDLMSLPREESALTSEVPSSHRTWRWSLSIIVASRQGPQTEYQLVRKSPMFAFLVPYFLARVVMSGKPWSKRESTTALTHQNMLWEITGLLLHRETKQKAFTATRDLDFFFFSFTDCAFTGSLFCGDKRNAVKVVRDLSILCERG